MYHLHRRRSLGQRLIDTLLSWVAVAIFLPFTFWMDREDRKAARR